MARLPRLVLAGEAHLVIQRALEGRPAFMDDEDRACYRAALHEALATERVALHAYALLEHEVLLLATPLRSESLARLMQAIGRRYVGAFNRRHGRNGTLWNGRFRACPVQAGGPLLQTMLWIDAAGSASGGGNHAASTDDAAGAGAPHGHALHAGAQACSLAHHGGAARDSLLTDPPEYWELGNTPFEREHAWLNLLAAGVAPAAATRLRRAALGGWALGTPGFVAEAAAAGGRPAAPRPRGRPRRPR